MIIMIMIAAAGRIGSFIRRPRSFSFLVGHDVVVIARRVAINVPFTDLVAELKTALERLVANSGSKGQKRAKSQPDAAQKLRKSGKDHKST